MLASRRRYSSTSGVKRLPSHASQTLRRLGDVERHVAEVVLAGSADFDVVEAGHRPTVAR
jgi:hypothetical protein